MTEPNDKEMHRYNVPVTIITDDIDNAERVLAERLNYSEDYGFWYEIDYDAYDLQPEEDTRGIIIDASVIREKFKTLVNTLSDSDPDNDRIFNAYERIKNRNASGKLNALISSTDDKRVWELFNEMCDRILDWIIDESTQKSEGKTAND
jgi:hypothetical protein